MRQLGGNKADVGEQGNWIMMLVSNYENISKEMTEMGFNGNNLVLKVEIAQPQQIITDQEKLINIILEDNAMNSISCI